MLCCFGFAEPTTCIPHSALNLRNLLDTIQANLSIFDEPNFRQRFKGNAFVHSPAAELKPPDHAQLKKDIEAVSVADPLVKKLVTWRHNFIAHRNSDYALNPNDLSSRYPLLFAEIDELLKRALEVGNRYSLLFDASVCSTMMVGGDDYLNVLKAVREHVQAYQRSLDEEWERLGAAAVSKCGGSSAKHNASLCGARTSSSSVDGCVLTSRWLYLGSRGIRA